MQPRFIRRCLCPLLAILVCNSAPAANPLEIQIAIDKAKAFLYAAQKPAGNWENALARTGTNHNFEAMQGDTFGGFTALCTYALLASGEAKSDPRITKATQFLQTADIIGIYALGLRANVWNLMSDRNSRANCEHDARLMIGGMQTGEFNPNTRGLWDYGNGLGPTMHGSGRFDHSVSQYGVLGLWACAQSEANVPQTVWKMIDAAWKAQQCPDGGWTYDTGSMPNAPTNPSMTAAGVATLFITDDMLNPHHGIECRGNISNPNIDLGLQWIAQHIKEVNNAYAWYGVERIGAASGRKYLGAADWYALGADSLLRQQLKDGSWRGGFGGGENPITATSFALLFLSRGREPVMINKLQYSMPDAAGAGLIEGNWNQRPRDVANLTRWTGRQLERSFGWQIVSLKGSVEDLHNAPILYISGNQTLRFSPEDEAKLREFVESGGMIVGNSDCGVAAKAFATSFEQLGGKLFPKYQFRDVPSDHSVFTNQPYHANKWKAIPQLRGLSNGVRELMLYLPDADPARSWQLRDESAQAPAFQLGADIFLYAVDKQNLNNKGETYWINPDPNIIGDRTVKVARLMIGKNYDPEPGGWRRLAGIIHNSYQADVDVQFVDPSKRLAGFKIAHLTGTDTPSLTPAARENLIDYVKNGGTLVIDAAGGKSAFADWIEAELPIMFGHEAAIALKAPMDLSDPLFRLAAAPIPAVTYRDTYRRLAIGKSKAPRLRGIRINGRLAVIYSREDLSAGMVGEPVDGIAGYSPQSATELMRNIILYCGLGFKPAR